MDITLEERELFSLYIESDWEYNNEDYWELLSRLSYKALTSQRIVNTIELEMLISTIEGKLYDRLDLMWVLKHYKVIEEMFSREELLRATQEVYKLQNTGDHLSLIEVDMMRLVWEALKK